MKRRNRRKCLYCKDEFEADVRNVKKQKCCGKAECRRAAKTARQGRWVAKNPEYFSGPENVARVQGWRAENPGYWRRPGSKGKGPRGQSAGALQDALAPQPHDPPEDFGTSALTSAPSADALQDALRTQDALLVGLIAHLIASTLQDDISATRQRLLQLGQDILSRTHAPEESAAARSAATRTGAVQLD
jgi:hypothetical protein